MARSSFVDDFKKFLLQGNVVDLAVAVIIGGAFAKIIDSFVKDIVTPAVLAPVLAAAKLDNIKALNFNGITYGNFLSEIITFLVIALSIFTMVRALETAKTKMARKKAVEEAAAPADPAVVLQEQMIASLDRVAKALENR
jgi:large conductance mechanosensitive channel